MSFVSSLPRRTAAAVTLAAAISVIPHAAHAEGFGAADEIREPVATAVPQAPLSAVLPPRQTGIDPREFRASMAAALTSTATASRYLGNHLSGVVISADGRPEWQYRTATTRMPASTQKLLTAHTVLRSMPAEAVLTTTALVTPADPDRIVLRGGGDPTMTRWRLGLLARAGAAALAARGGAAPGGAPREVTLVLDASAIPASGSAAGWKASYIRTDVQLVQGLPFAGYRGNGSAATVVGRVFAEELAKSGVRVKSTSFGKTPAGATEIARVTSAPVGDLVGQMLATSNNDIAEHLLRHAALARGRTATWWGALRNERDLLAAAGVPTTGLTLADGSGLSRANRVPVMTLAEVIRVMYHDPVMARVVFAWGALPRSGQTGTLANRFHTPAHACAIGAVTAKTGTLVDTVALAGVVKSVDGNDRVFVLLENGLTGSNRYARLAEDTMATLMVGCRTR